MVAALKLFFAGQPQYSYSPELFIGRPGLRGGTHPAQAVDHVAAGVHAAFAPGGTCTTCHTVVKPGAPGALNYAIAPVRLTSRYLPWGDFNHNVPEHHQDANGAPNCDTCHKAKNSAHAQDVMLPGIAACGTCHGKTRAQVPTAAGSDCAECHGFHNPGLPASPRRRELAQSALIRSR